jgi:hypothetical protein
VSCEYLFIVSLVRNDNAAVLRFEFFAEDLNEMPAKFIEEVKSKEHQPIVVAVDVDGAFFKELQYPVIIGDYICGGVLFCSEDHLIADVYVTENTGL